MKTFGDLLLLVGKLAEPCLSRVANPERRLSIRCPRCATVRNQALYEEFHWALMGMNYRAEEATVTRIVEVAGLDLEQLRRDMKELQIETLIETSERFSQALGFNGTPSFVTGDAHVPDFVDVEDLRALVANVRDENE